MLKRWHIVALVSLTLAAGLFAVSFLFPASYEVCGPDDYNHIKECTYYHGGPAVIAAAITWADIHNGLLTALATLGLVLVTFLLVKLGREQARITQAQIRAAVFLDGVNLKDAPAGLLWPIHPGGPVAIVAIQNSGDTTAYNVRHFCEVKVAQVLPDGRVTETALTYPTNMETLSATTIGKGGKTFMTRSLGRVLTPADLIDISTFPAAHAIIVYGRITYDDAFGYHHRLDYCLGFSGLYPPAPNVPMIFSTNGNYSD